MIKTNSNVDNLSASAEEKERRLAEQRSIAAHRLQRKQRLQAMIQKRQTNFAYLQKVHQGGCYWLNTVQLTAADIKAYTAAMVSKQRIESFFSLGVSIAGICGKTSPGLPTVRAFSQLLEEWEFVHSGATMQSVKLMMAKNSVCMYPQCNPYAAIASGTAAANAGGSSGSNASATSSGGGGTVGDGGVAALSAENVADLQRPSVYKFHSSVVYEFLQLPHIPFDLDYVEVVVGLCIQMSKLYESLIDADCYSNVIVYDTIVRLDTRIKHHVINLMAKELTHVCSRKVRSGTNLLRILTGMLFPASNSSNSSSSSSASGGTTSPGAAGTGSAPSTPKTPSSSSSSSSSKPVTPPRNVHVTTTTTSTALANQAVMSSSSDNKNNNSNNSTCVGIANVPSAEDPPEVAPTDPASSSSSIALLSAVTADTLLPPVRPPKPATLSATTTNTNTITATNNNTTGDMSMATTATSSNAEEEEKKNKENKEKAAEDSITAASASAAAPSVAEVE
mmetsp:Transcript_9596/g.15968  ORF Transcript_9596/g.15968 Transcript_9596/m.15968 type:complete len:506 (+) Transcript_9596:29-1546(+)